MQTITNRQQLIDFCGDPHRMQTRKHPPGGFLEAGIVVQGASMVLCLFSLQDGVHFESYEVFSPEDCSER